MAFTLTSPSFADGAQIPTEYTCDGANISPPLRWDDPPPGTASFVLILEAPDAPAETSTHWILFDIPATQRELPAGSGGTDTIGTPGLNHFSRTGYDGPCPAPGEAHHYVFRLLALDFAPLDLPADSPRRDVEALLGGHVLGEAVLTGRYARA